MALDLEGIKGEYCSARDLCNSNLMGALSSGGFSNVDLDMIGDDISSLTSCVIDLDALMDLIYQVMDELEGLLGEGINAWRQLQKLFQVDTLFQSHDVMNAKRSISLPEPILTTTNQTNIQPVADADYTVNENYSRSYGQVDDAKNWYKVDKESGLAQYVHNSQSQFKIDENGNAVLAFKGSVKLVIEGDLGFEVKGNVDFRHNAFYELSNGDKITYVMGNRDSTVEGNVKESYNSQQTTNVSGNVTIKGSTINLN